MDKNHWRKIRDIHFHSSEGSPFWLRRVKEMGLDVFQEVKEENDFWKLGELSLKTIRETPPNDFLPQSFSQEKIPVESGGSTGEPILTYFTPREFEAAFVTPFLRAVEEGFPAQGPWLYLGPTGPHAVGRAARLCSLKTSGQEPYMIDFDPRWAKKLPPTSMGAERYLNHLGEQALSLFRKVKVAVLFCTPPILDWLGENLEEDKRKGIQGIQLAGMAVDKNQWERWQRSFPQAHFLIGYGNSLAGVFYPREKSPGYCVSSSRVHFSVLKLNEKGQGVPGQLAREGEKGQVVLHRLDESILYLNLLERDQAIRSSFGKEIFLQEVGPLSSVFKIRKGLY